MGNLGRVDPAIPLRQPCGPGLCQPTKTFRPPLGELSFTVGCIPNQQQWQIFPWSRRESLKTRFSRGLVAARNKVIYAQAAGF